MEINFKRAVLFGALGAMGCIVSSADPIYSSTTWNNSVFQMQNGQEVGNEINVPAGNSLDDFQIEYLLPANLTADVGIDVRFYTQADGANQGTYTDPGSLFFDSGFTSLSSLGVLYTSAGSHNVDYTTADFSTSGAWTTSVTPLYVLPTDFTFTVTFDNLDSGNVVQMPLANNNGQNDNGYFINGVGGWTLNTNSLGPVNFLADFSGTVPEPSALGLTGIGGALLLGINRLRRKG